MSESHEALPASDGPPEEPGVPWVDPDIQQCIDWRDGDIVISVPLKSGTTWTMNIVHQLRSGGDPDLEDVYLEVPWLELISSPERTQQDVADEINAMRADRRRAFKTHSPPGPLPYQAPGSGRDVQYIVVLRHPDEVAASMHPFIGAHTEEWFRLWGMERGEFVPPDLATFLDTMGTPMLAEAVFGFLGAWWPLRNEPNVLLMHFSDMKADHEGSIRKIADFLGFEPRASEWPAILECTSFPWMKKNGDRFELRGVSEVPILESGAMVRKGRSGKAKDDGVTAEISAELARVGREALPDPDAFDWLYSGGRPS